MIFMVKLKIKDSQLVRTSGGRDKKSDLGQFK